MLKAEKAQLDPPHILKFLVLARQLSRFSRLRSLDKIPLTSQRHCTGYCVFWACSLRDLLAMSFPLEITRPLGSYLHSPILR